MYCSIYNGKKKEEETQAALNKARGNKKDPVPIGDLIPRNKAV